MELILPVEVPAAALADHEAGRRAQLLDRLRADAHAAAATDRGRGHHGHRHAAARLEDAVVAREHAGGQLLRARRALGAHDRELLLDGGELLAYDRLVLPRQPRRFALEAADAGVEALKIYECLQLCVHDVSVVGMITIDCDPQTVDCEAEPHPSISGHPRFKPIRRSNTMVGPPGFEPRPFRL